MTTCVPQAVALFTAEDRMAHPSFALSMCPGPGNA